MRETKVKNRIEDTDDPFFQYRRSPENAALQNSAGRAELSRQQREVSAREPKIFSNFLKQAFLFFPGTFILFYVSLATAGVLTAILKNSDKNFIFEAQLIFIYLSGFLSIFLTWLGLGDLRNKKHFVIPGSIILSGAVIGTAVSLTENIFWLSEKIIVDFGYAIWLFPIGLIVPFLAKGWVDRKADKL